jgi:hypothetical protein
MVLALVLIAVFREAERFLRTAADRYLRGESSVILPD